MNSKIKEYSSNQEKVRQETKYNTPKSSKYEHSIGAKPVLWFPLKQNTQVTKYHELGRLIGKRKGTNCIILYQ